MGLSTTYTKAETDFLIQQLEKKTASGYKGDLRKSDPAPTQIGFYGLIETGIYPNLGNINAEAGKLNFASFDGTTWSKVEVALPNASTTFDKVNNVSSATMKATSDYFEGDFLLVKDEALSAALPLPSANSFYGGLAHTTPFAFSGKLTKIKIRASQSGDAKFQIIRKVSSGTTGVQQFIGIQTFTVPSVVIGINDYILSSPIDIVEGDYLMWYAVSPDTLKVAYGASDASPINGWWQASVNGAISSTPTNFILQAAQGGVAIQYTINSEESRFTTHDEFETFKNSFETEIVRITATRNANNYNSIRELMSSITDASVNKIYEIYIPDGEWFEFDLQGKKYIKLIGQSRDKTILYCDGTSTNPLHVAPTDFSYPAEAGKQIASINVIYRHLFFVKNDTHVENITIKQISGKYCTHIDNAYYKSAFFKNVRLISIDNSYPVGIGIWAGQSIVFEDFVIDHLETTPTTSRKLGFFIHNSINQSQGTYFIAENGVFHGCGYGTISELGSTKTDDWNFINCSTDSIGEFFYMVDVSVAGTYPNPRDVPYNIRLNTYGTKVDLVYDRPASNFPAPHNVGTQRPDFYKYMVSDYVQKVMPVAGSAIVKGDIIAIDDSSLPTFQRFIAKKLNSATDIRLGVALENAVDGQKLRYTPLDKYALTFVNGVINPNYANYKMKLNASYQLESDATLTPQNVIGLALEIKGAGLGLHYVKVN